MKYDISQIEISRRKRAYFRLSTSVMVGLVLASVILDFPVSIGGYLLTTAIIFLIGAFSFRFLHKLSQTKFVLSNQVLERKTNKTSEKYLLKEVNRVKIKWTTNKTIREVYIWLNNRQRIFVSALKHFTEFRKDFLNKLKKDVKIEETREPIDFDHPLFYAVLGLPISTISVLVFKSIPLLSYQHIRAFIIGLVGYLVVLGIYFILTKPLSNRYGNKVIISDYLTGIFMIGCAIAMLFLLFCLK